MPRRWRMVVALVFYVLLGYFLLRYLRGTDWTQLADLDVDALYMLLAIPLSLLPRLLQPLAWRMLISGYGERPPAYAQLTRVYATSWLGRYIPGKVAWIGAKIFLGRQYGIGADALAATAVAEAALHLSTALAVAFALVTCSRADATTMLGADARLLAIVALAAISVVLLPPVFNRIIALARSVRGVSDGSPQGRLSTSTLVASGSTYVAIHVLSGVPVWLILRSMHGGLSPALFPELTAAVLFAGTLGTLAVFAPAGLGVREGILIVLLSLLVPRPIAVAAVVVLRLWSIAMDLLFYGLAVLVERRRRVEGS